MPKPATPTLCQRQHRHNTDYKQHKCVPSNKQRMKEQINNTTTIIIHWFTGNIILYSKSSKVVEVRIRFSKLQEQQQTRFTIEYNICCIKVVANTAIFLSYIAVAVVIILIFYYYYCCTMFVYHGTPREMHQKIAMTRQDRQPQKRTEGPMNENYQMANK